RYYLNEMKQLIDMKTELTKNKFCLDLLKEAKKNGLSDSHIAKLWDTSEKHIFELRKAENMMPVYKKVNTCAAAFESETPYFYSTYEQENESLVTERKKILILGSGPIRIGQGIEFDYATVHSVLAIRDMGYEAIIMNNNPETYSTDFSISDKL